MSNTAPLTDEQRARAASQLLAEMDPPTNTTQILAIELSKDAGELAAEIAYHTDNPDAGATPKEHTEEYDNE